MEIEEFYKVLINSNLTWLAEEIKSFINLGKIKEKEFKDSLKNSVKGLTTEEYSQEEKLQICLEWIYNLFIILPGMVESIEKELNFIEDKNVHIKFLNEKEEVILADIIPNLNSRNELRNEIFKNSKNEKWKDLLKNDNWN